ncbi:hypothetical protein [Siccirubricoccus phaeus]|uniref:hypothetical protein n=1 Tax=Siccirubricoccus phaeus TaxID=2595053 RepID=UPI001A9C43F9|nr:hypothetical protein [Siccirubricoccus phaeus]
MAATTLAPASAAAPGLKGVGGIGLGGGRPQRLRRRDSCAIEGAFMCVRDHHRQIPIPALPGQL